MDGLKGGEYGFLLLTSHLGNPDRKPLTVPQFRMLQDRMKHLRRRKEDLELDPYDLMSIGFGKETALHIVDLLGEAEQLRWYLMRAAERGIRPITRATESYPLILRRRLGKDAPGVLWARGDLSLLQKPAIALVGSRDLKEKNRLFAEEVGYQAARQGLVLVSGNARGADRTAQNACLAAGGQVISVVADSLLDHTEKEHQLFLSELSYDEPFSPQRALSRNRVIHALGRMTLVAQTDLEKGGTWHGTVKNLHHGWSGVACFRDGSGASRRLEDMGAFLLESEDLTDLGVLAQPDSGFL